MTRPKPLPNELLSDLSISTATKLQCFRVFFYILDVRVLNSCCNLVLQKNWKIKQQRTTISTPSNEGFTIDLCDNSLSDPMAVYRSPSISSIKVDHDSAGMLSVNLPPKSCRSIQFGFVGDHSGYKLIKVSKKEYVRDEDVDASAKETHSILREVHRAIFDEQVFDLVNREAVSPSVGVNVTGIRENYLELGIGQGASVYLSLEPLGQYVDEFADEQNWENVPSDGSDTLNKLSAFPSSVSFEIYLQQIFHGNIDQTVKGFDLLGHFCLTLAHRIFSNKVLAQLENLASKISHLHLLSRPTWHSRTSSWSLLIKVPPSVLDAGNRIRPLNIHSRKNGVKSQFETRVVVIDDCVNIEGEGAPNVVSLFKGGSEEMGSLNSYDYDLADLPVIILQQVASQVVGWLHEEALMVGMKASRDFLSLSFELEQGDRLSLVAHVDPRDTQGCISWYLVMADGFMEETKLGKEESEKMKYLGFLSLETLYSLLMDLLSLCNRDANH
ncbi:hypothetical protein ACHQM5_010141 [Ranunculus cassubicifolius]